MRYPVYVVITFITPFGICAKEKCLVVKVDRHNLHNRLAVSIKKYDVTIGQIYTSEDFLHVHSKARFASCHEDLAENLTSLNNDNIHK